MNTELYVNMLQNKMFASKTLGTHVRRTSTSYFYDVRTSYHIKVLLLFEVFSVVRDASDTNQSLSNE